MKIQIMSSRRTSCSGSVSVFLRGENTEAFLFKCPGCSYVPSFLPFKTGIPLLLWEHPFPTLRIQVVPAAFICTSINSIGEVTCFLGPALADARSMHAFTNITGRHFHFNLRTLALEPVFRQGDMQHFLKMLLL